MPVGQNEEEDVVISAEAEAADDESSSIEELSLSELNQPQPHVAHHEQEDNTSRYMYRIFN